MVDTTTYCMWHGLDAGHTVEDCPTPTREVVHTLTMRLPVDVTLDQIGMAASAAFVQWDEADDDEYAPNDPDAPVFRAWMVSDVVTVDGENLDDLQRAEDAAAAP